MRLAPLFVLLPTFAVAQDVPSLQRPSAALPITESVAVMRSRLGGTGGPFAAAQLALEGGPGRDALFSVRNDPDPFARLDAAYGLGLTGTYAGYLGLAWSLGDPDPRVADEAEHGFRIAGASAVAALRQAAYSYPPRSADRAAEWLRDLRDWSPEWLAREQKASGRAGAIRALDIPFERALPVFVDAAHDLRTSVRFESARRIVFGPKTSARTAALDRLSRDRNPAVRLSLARAMDEDPGSVLDAAYERAQRYGPVGSRRNFARMVGNGLYDPARLRAATTILGRLSNDPSPTVADAAVEELYLFVEDRLGEGNDGRGESQRDDVPWNDLPTTTVASLRRGVGRRLGGPVTLKAAVVLARLHDDRAYPVLASAAFVRDDRVALASLGVLGDRRATPRLLERLHQEPGDYATYDALQRLRDPAAIPALLALVRNGDPAASVPTLAAQTIADIGDRSAAPRLVAAAGNSVTRMNLYVPIGRLGGPDAVRYLLERLKGDPPNTTQYATLGLGELRDPADVATLKRFAASGAPRAASARQVLETIAYRARLRTETRGQGSPGRPHTRP